MSRTLGLPTLRELVAEMARDLGYDPEVFERLGSFSTLAEYYALEMEGLGGLRSKLDAAWHRDGIDISKSIVHRIILELEFPIIYTTNWDRWLERAHDAAGIPYQTIVGVGDLRHLQPNEVQIVKFHGDFTDDESLVLTESSYMRRLDFSSPLDIKLRSDALGKSLLFLGYSLDDPNTRLLLFRLRELWSKTRYPQAQPRSFLVTSRPNPVQECVLKDWGVSSLTTDTSHGSDQGGQLAILLADLAEKAHGKIGLLREDVP